MSLPDNLPHQLLRHHISGAIERGEGEAIIEQPVKYPHIAVIGRIPEDDEDSIYFFTDLTEIEARSAFEKAIYDDICGDKTPSEVEEQWGVSCYINAILASDSKIRAVA